MFHSRENAQYIARSTVDRFKDESLPPLLRAQCLDSDPLDMSGPYKFAVDYGLHDAIYSAFIVDHYAVENFTTKHPNNNALYQCSLTQRIMASLFRGERMSKDPPSEQLLRKGRRGTHSGIPSFSSRRWIASLVEGIVGIGHGMSPTTK